MRRRAAYGIAALILLVVEVLIALFVNDQFVRPYLGDVLAVMLVYAALRAATPMGFSPALSIALGIALVIKVAQALNLLGALGLADNQFARIVLGGSFDMLDMAAYLAGGVVVLALESGLRRAGRGQGL